MILPTDNFTVKIGPLTWQFVYSEDVVEEGDCYAATHLRRQRSFLDPRAREDNNRLSVIHEVLHVIFYLSGLHERLTNKESQTEEDVVREMATLLTQVIQDNPALFKVQPSGTGFTMTWVPTAGPIKPSES